MAEALWEPDLEADALFETISQSLLNVSTLFPHQLGTCIVNPDYQLAGSR